MARMFTTEAPHYDDKISTPDYTSYNTAPYNSVTSYYPTYPQFQNTDHCYNRQNLPNRQHNPTLNDRYSPKSCYQDFSKDYPNHSNNNSQIASNCHLSKSVVTTELPKLNPSKDKITPFFNLEQPKDKIVNNVKDISFNNNTNNNNNNVNNNCNLFLNKISSSDHSEQNSLFNRSNYGEISFDNAATMDCSNTTSQSDPLDDQSNTCLKSGVKLLKPNENRIIAGLNSIPGSPKPTVTEVCLSQTPQLPDTPPRQESPDNINVSSDCSAIGNISSDCSSNTLHKVQNNNSPSDCVNDDSLPVVNKDVTSVCVYEESVKSDDIPLISEKQDETDRSKLTPNPSVKLTIRLRPNPSESECFDKTLAPTSPTSNQIDDKEGPEVKETNESKENLPEKDNVEQTPPTPESGKPAYVKLNSPTDPDDKGEKRSKRVKKPSLKFLESVCMEPDPNDYIRMIFSKFYTTPKPEPQPQQKCESPGNTPNQLERDKSPVNEHHEPSNIPVKVEQMSPVKTLVSTPVPSNQGLGETTANAIGNIPVKLEQMSPVKTLVSTPVLSNQGLGETTANAIGNIPVNAISSVLNNIQRPAVPTQKKLATPTKVNTDDLIPWPILGEGWKRYQVMRKNGASAGRYDVYYVSPGGKKHRSKPELQMTLGSSLDLFSFNFRLGVFLEGNGRLPPVKRKKMMGELADLPPLITAQEDHVPVSLISRHPPTDTKSPSSDDKKQGSEHHFLVDNSDPSSPYYEFREKAVRCRTCENCLRENCGQCVYCKDMKRFGGNNSLRQTCVHRRCSKGLKVRIAVKAKKPRDHIPALLPADMNTPPTLLSSAAKRQKKCSYNQAQEAMKLQQQMGKPAVTASYNTIQKYILTSHVPSQFGLPKDHVMNVTIGNRRHKCPVLWIDDIFHNQTVTHYYKFAKNPSQPVPPAPWPIIMKQFYNFVFQVTVTVNDVTLQFHVVEQIKGQYQKVTHFCIVNGSHVRDMTVDVQFCKFLESVELYQYLPNHPKNPKKTENVITENVQRASDTAASIEDEMLKICTQLDNIIRDNTRIEQSLKDLLLKYLSQSDLCTFILAVVNSNSVPTDVENMVVEVLKTHLNLPGIANLTDLTGSAITQPEVGAVETVSEVSTIPKTVSEVSAIPKTLSEVSAIPKAVSEMSTIPKPSHSAMNISKTLANLVPHDRPLNESVKKFILGEPLQVIKMINELQKLKPLTIDNLSDMILERIGANNKTPAAVPRHAIRGAVPGPSITTPGASHVVLPQNIHTNLTPDPGTPIINYNNHLDKKNKIPRGYNPRYYSPYLGPQHQQRYGRPPLRRTAPPNLSAIQHIQAPAIPPPMKTVHATTVPIQCWPGFKDIPKIGKPVMVDQAVQVKPENKDIGHQSYIPSSNNRKKKAKFVDLNFCPHV